MDDHAPPAVSPAPYLDEVQTCRTISSARAEKDPGALDQQSLVAGLGRTRRRREHRQVLRRPEAGLDHQDRRTILYRAWVHAAAENFLGKIGSLSAPGRFKAEEEH